MIFPKASRARRRIGRVEIGTVGGQEEQPGADRFCHGAHRLALVTIEIVANDDVVRFQGLDEFGPEMGLARLGVNQTIEHLWCLDAIVAQRAGRKNKKPALTADGEPAMAAHASRHDVAKTPLAGCPFDDARYRNIQRRRDHAAALASRKRAITPSPKSIV